MAKSVMLPIKDGNIRGAINTFLRDLIVNKVVEAILVPITHPAGESVVPTLVADSEYLEQADVFAPLLPVISARIVSAMTRLAPVSKKTAVVMRPCEIRALVELVKLKQAQLDNILLISVDCAGVYSLKDYKEFAAKDTSNDFVKRSLQNREDPKLRAGCQMCQYPVPLAADLTIGTLGVDLKQGLLFQADTEKGEQALREVGLTVESDSEMCKQREAAIEKLLAAVKDKRQKFFEQTKEEIAGLDKLSAILASCVNCHNCRDACPICYCRECFFDSPTFELEADRYLGMAGKKGAIRMPTDTLLFHLTRMTHMATSCVGCGACQEACPNDIPLLKIFQLVGEKTQKLFDYTPGHSLDDDLPPTTYKEKEFQNLGTK